jgi:ABC-2 type transport system permease protein
MNDRVGVVYDLGYTPYEGERRGRRGAFVTTVKDGVARVFGIRRGARKKILPFLLLGLALIPAVVFVGFAFLLSTFSPDAESPFGSYSSYFALAGTIVLLFVALAAPELLIPDRRYGVLSIYSSRPTTADDYVAARASALFIAIAIFLLVPQLLMYVGFSALSSDGFATALVDNAIELPRILLAAIAFMVAYGSVALLVSTIASRKAVAAGAILGLFIIGTGVASGLVQAVSVPGHRFAAFFALAEHPLHVTEWIFGTSSPDGVMRSAGFDAWVSLLIIVGLAVVSAVIVTLRYRRWM